MTDNEKIKAIIRSFHAEKRRYSTYAEPTDDTELTDTLINANIGDVSAISARAKLAEANDAIKAYALREFTTQVGCQHCPFYGRCELAQPDSDNDYQACYDTILKISERELQTHNQSRANSVAKSLRWIVNQIPEFEPSTDEEKMLITIKHYCEAGAKEIERLSANK